MGFLIKTKKETYQPPHVERLELSSPLNLLVDLSFHGGLDDIVDEGEW